MAKKISICIGFLMLMANTLFANYLPGDTVKSDIPVIAKDIIKNETPVKAIKDTIPVHSPKKASVYSAVLPGLGQAYNKKYWKIPLVYGGFAAFGYFIRWNNRNYNTSRQAYMDLTDKDPNTNSYMKLKQIIYYDLNNSSSVANLKQGLLSTI